MNARKLGIARVLAAPLAVTALALVPAISSGDHVGPVVPGPATFPQTVERILSARVHHTRLSVVRNTNSRRIGRSLASLHPTWVTGLIRYAKGQHPNHSEVHTWREITRIVRLGNPTAGFDVTLNAKQYRDGDELLRAMHRIRKRLHNDGWFFDFYSTAYHKRPRMIRAAIASAHAHGEWIGGNVFGLTKHRPLPMRSDFLAVQDFRLRLDVHAVAQLARRIPVVYHLENDPNRPLSGGCSFIKTMTTARRSALIRHRAHQAARFGFHVSYPALFPECLRYRGPRSFLQSYNAFRDPPMGRTILRMLNRYD
ncbi:MAG: hypothetical protein QOI10_1806 [Solirubrobacterales bacterium]|jgi:hypothetical protein|nr:hypothetical protein [Solirubrobacterales bacterium]